LAAKPARAVAAAELGVDVALVVAWEIVVLVRVLELEVLVEE